MAEARIIKRIVLAGAWALNAAICFAVGLAYVVAASHRHDAWLVGVAVGIGLVGLACGMGAAIVWRKPIP